MRICVISILFAFFFNFSLKAQLHFKDPTGPLHFRIDLEKSELWKENKIGKWAKVSNIQIENFISQDLPSNPMLLSFELEGNILLYLEGTGQLYLLNKNQNTFSRIDKTFYRGYNFGAIRYVKNDTLFSVGGNGFWHLNNIETYFSLKSKEWELYHTPSEDGPKQIKSTFGGYDRTRDLLSVIELPQLYQDSDNKFPFRYFEKPRDTKDWIYKGNLNVSELHKLGIQNIESTYLDGFYIFRNGPTIVIGDPSDNGLYQIDQVLPILNELFEFSETKGFIYSYHTIKSGYGLDNSIKVDSISIAGLKSLGRYKGKFYVKPTPLILCQIGLGIIVLILGLLLGFLIKNSQKTSTSSLKMDSEFSILDGLPDGAFEFLKASLALPKGHQFSSQAFTELMGFSSYAYETQRQLRSKLIKSINAYFSIHYRMQDVIIRKTANDDKRFSIYYISEEHFERLKDLLG